MSTVYILGAGASAGAERTSAGIKCPSAKNFFSVAGRLLNSFSEDSFRSYPNLTFFLEQYFKLDYTQLEKAGLDMQDVLTFLDLELEYSDSQKEIDVLQRARGEFMDLLTLVFNNVISGPPCPYHTALASSLRKGDTVISFNYDLLMDSAMERNVPDWTPGTGYGLKPLTTGKNRDKEPPVYLLKPHGSFNWINCKTCGNAYVLPTGQTQPAGQRPELNRVFGEPEDHFLERFIIPPSLKKDVHGKLMQRIWLKAGEALQKARRIVVIGYSLPATDFLVKRLLYRSLSQNRCLLEFELVDRKNSRAKNPLMEKYRRILFGPGNVRLVSNKKNIREYAAALQNIR
ncbi:MAG: hypothetical protein ACOY30_05945 [Bacillota bacterium]